MIAVWREYVISVVGSCMLCGILCAFVTDSKKKDLLRLVCGIIITMTVAAPLTRRDISWQFPEELLEIADDGEILAAGEALAREEASRRIIAGCEAYILDKAELTDSGIQVEITLDDRQLPAFAEIRGDCSGETRRQLEALLESDLGITKENQRWTGKQEKNGS